MLMITSFLTAWLGYAVVCFLRLMGVNVPPIGVAMAMLLAKVGGLLNAIVFVFMNAQVRYISSSVKLRKNYQLTTPSCTGVRVTPI